MCFTNLFIYLFKIHSSVSEHLDCFYLLTIVNFPLLIYLFIYLAALGLRYCAWAFSSCDEWATLCYSARASHCGGFSCCGARALGAWASVVVARGLSSCDSRALERRLGSCAAWA